MMKVADLQRFVDGLTQPMKSAGANQKVIDDLTRMIHGLEPFKERTIEEFSQFLQTAHNYMTDGTLPEPGRRSSRGRSGDGTPRVSVEEAAQRVMALVERAAAEPSLELVAIEAELKNLDGLTGAQLKQVAEQADLSVPARPRSKEDLLRAMATAIKERKRSSARTPQRTASSEEGLPVLNAGHEGVGHHHRTEHTHAKSERQAMAGSDSGNA